MSFDGFPIPAVTIGERASIRRIAVAPALLEAVLSPYRAECRYLKAAEVEASSGPESGAGDAGPLALARGDFSIPESFYIQDTGHFNAVEFNLCYNQLVYVLMAQCVASKLLPPFARMTVEEYRRRQLPDVLIHTFASTFKRPLEALRFQGIVTIDALADRRRFLMVRTRCQFDDEHGGHAEGAVTLAIVNRLTRPESAASA